jgi:hypothetical protein
MAKTPLHMQFSSATHRGKSHPTVVREQSNNGAIRVAMHDNVF